MNTAADGARFWFEAQPERLQWELDRFEDQKLPATHRVARVGPGTNNARLVIDTELEYKNQLMPIQVLFPFDYPDAPPEFHGPAGLLDRHQTPDGTNLCWSADPDRDWYPGRDAAYIVANNLRALLADLEKGASAVRAAEADMPEPLSGFIRFERSHIVVVPDPFFAHTLPASRGKLDLLRDNARLFLLKAEGLGEADRTLRRRFMPAGKQEPRGYWVDLWSAPSVEAFNGTEDWDLPETVPELFRHLDSTVRRKPFSLTGAWLGVTFMEEGPLRGQLRRNWVFGSVTYDPSGGATSVRWFPAQALTREERQRRTPELVGLEGARALVVGAGSLGAPVAFELAKAGVGHIDIVDPDIFDINNAVRHGLPVTCAGQNKAEAVAEAAIGLNPFVALEHYDFTAQGGTNASEQLLELIRAATVVVDTTGSNSAARLLQRFCLDSGRTLVIAGLTAGSYGAVLRIAVPSGPCFECFVLRQDDGAIPPVSAAPPTSLVTPVGCSHPAFAGAGFEATQLAAATSRAVVQLTGLCSYPEIGFNWAVMNFRDAPRWRSGVADRHPDCWRHT
ncbi:MAG: ThiF family adenylyltransferase [Actinomycetota bacterium]|nr:ThiF family adenylyltransferase [Actinomycetota bacterium]